MAAGIGRTESRLHRLQLTAFATWSEASLKDAKFPNTKTLEGFDFTAQPSINKPPQKNLWVKSG